MKGFARGCTSTILQFRAGGVMAIAPVQAQQDNRLIARVRSSLRLAMPASARRIVSQDGHPEMLCCAAIERMRSCATKRVPRDDATPPLFHRYGTTASCGNQMGRDSTS
jgi:hypothetical protein